MICNANCQHSMDYRSGETYCWQHGWIVFNRQAYDALDDSDLERGEQNMYSDKFIANAYNAYMNRGEGVDNLSSDIGVSLRTIYRALKRFGVSVRRVS